MTRETKAGLVVSCSFLCLVGVVLYCKLNGKSPSVDGAGSESASVEAPADPTPLDDISPNNGGPAILASTSNNAGPGPASEKLAADSSKGGSKPSSSENDGYTIPASTSCPGNEGTAISSASSTKTASAQIGSTYSIPDAITNEKDPESRSAGSESKDRSANESKSGATLDPLSELKEAYKEAKAALPSKNELDGTKTTGGVSSESSKDNSKNSETVRNGGSPVANSSEVGTTTAMPETNGSSPKGDKNFTERTKLADQESPPPIPAGLPNPFRSLPEVPPPSANTSETANRSPRDAALRKGVPPQSANGTATAAGSNRNTVGVIAGANQGTVSTTMPNLNPTGGSSPSRSDTGPRDRDGRIATNSGQGTGLTPGVMPSPRLSGIPPAGDTAPEPNVRLGPPTAGFPANPSGQNPARDPAAALPPSNQFAQAPAPNPAVQSPPTANPYRPPVSAPGPIQPAGFPAAKVDSYDEETYLCKQGDKFEDISAKFYQTDKYAQALLLFNRNHPRATATVRQDPPTLAAGQPVYIPPLRVLERQYATAIPDHAPVNPGPTPSGANPDAHNTATTPAGSGVASGGPAASQNSALPDNRNLTSGTGVSPDGQAGGQYSTPPDLRSPVQPAAVPGPLPPNRPPVQGQERIYQVPKNGETFWEISRRTLGNPNRWSEISRLNPQIKPQYPVPGDTNLKMPADARLDAPSPMAAEKVQ